MRVKTHSGLVRVAVLIPTRQRSTLVAKQLRLMPFLDNNDTIYGIDENEVNAYEAAIPNSRVEFVVYPNPDVSVGRCRDELRKAALRVRPKYDWFIATDDNARFTLQSLTNLVRCAAEFPEQPTIMAGIGELMKYFAKGKEDKLPDLRTINGLRSTQRVNHIFVAIPRAIYRQFAYPHDATAAEDRYLSMWAIKRGIPVRECLDAPYSKPRQQPGGTGDQLERMRATGLGMARLAADFPEYVGCTGSIPARWSIILKLAQGYRFKDRLPGGAARREDDVLKSMVKDPSPKRG